jgi:hypothetical protein
VFVYLGSARFSGSPCIKLGLSVNNSWVVIEVDILIMMKLSYFLQLDISGQPWLLTDDCKKINKCKEKECDCTGNL